MFRKTLRPNGKNGWVSESWFSASLRFATTVSATVVDREDSIIVFRADGWQAALPRAVELGRGMEETYENVEREPVERRLVEVRTLDELGASIEDGREVYCARAVDESHVQPGRPEDSRPLQTGV